jgi:hypothetical protein
MLPLPFSCLDQFALAQHPAFRFVLAPSAAQNAVAAKVDPHARVRQLEKQNRAMLAKLEHCEKEGKW